MTSSTLASFQTPFEKFTSGNLGQSTFAKLAVGVSFAAGGGVSSAMMGKGMLISNSIESWAQNPELAMITTTAMAVAAIASAGVGMSGIKCIIKVAAGKLDAFSQWREGRKMDRELSAAQPELSNDKQMIISQKDTSRKSLSDVYFVGTVGKNDFRQVNQREMLEFKAEHRKSGKLLEISEGISGKIKLSNESGTSYISEREAFAKFPQIEEAYNAAFEAEFKAIKHVADVAEDYTAKNGM